MTTKEFLQKYPFKDGELVWYLNTEGEFEQIPASIQQPSENIIVHDVNVGDIDLTLEGKVQHYSTNRVIFHAWEKPKIETVKPRGKDALGNIITTEDSGYYYYRSYYQKVQWCKFNSGLDGPYPGDENCFKYEKDALAYAETKGNWFIKPLPEVYKFCKFDGALGIVHEDSIYHINKGQWYKNIHHSGYKNVSVRLTNVTYVDIVVGDWIAYGYGGDEDFLVGLVCENRILWLDNRGCFTEEPKLEFIPREEDYLFKITKAND